MKRREFITLLRATVARPSAAGTESPAATAYDLAE